MNTITRRHFIRNSTAFLTAINVFPYYNGRSQVSITSQSVHRFSIGKAKCSVLRDFTRAYNSNGVVMSIDGTDVRKKYINYRDIQSDTIQVDYNTILVRINDKNILIDTGIGYYKKPIQIGQQKEQIHGQLQNLLKAENLTPEEIDYVLITHFHPDHIGGIYNESGRLNFPNAKFVMSTEERDFWYSDQGKQMPASFLKFINQNISPIEKADILYIKEDSTDVIPGITAFKATGHTPGHMVFLLESDGEKMMVAGDTFCHPLHIEDQNVVFAYDYDKEQAINARTKVLSLANENNALIHAFHFDFPGLVYVSLKGPKWKWNYIQTH